MSVKHSQLSCCCFSQLQVLGQFVFGLITTPWPTARGQQWHWHLQWGRWTVIELKHKVPFSYYIGKFTIFPHCPVLQFFTALRFNWAILTLTLGTCFSKSPRCFVIRKYKQNENVWMKKWDTIHELISPARVVICKVFSCNQALLWSLSLWTSLIMED